MLSYVFVFDFVFLVDDLCVAWGGELVLHCDQFVLYDGEDVGVRAQNVEIIGNLDGELVELILDLVAAERGQALQT